MDKNIFPTMAHSNFPEKGKLLISKKKKKRKLLISVKGKITYFQKGKQMFISKKGKLFISEKGKSTYFQKKKEKFLFPKKGKIICF